MGIAEVSAQDPYRSKTTGNWSAASSWERHNGTSWVDAAAFPTSADGAITIRSGHSVTIDAGVGLDFFVDQLTVDSGGVLIVSYTTKITDGSGIDLTVHGQVTVSAATTLTIAAAASVDIESGGQVSVIGGITAAGSSRITFKDGSTYEHARNGGNLPLSAATTWDSGSTVIITGVTVTIPTQLFQSFHHFIWNSPSQTAALNLNGAIGSIGGDFTVSSTGSGTLAWVQNPNTNFPITGGYIQTGGTFIYTWGTSAGVMSAASVSVTGGTLDLASAAGIPTLNVTGSLTVSGSGALTETGTGSATITLTGGSTQSVSAPTGITNTVHLTVNNTGGIQLLTDLSAPANLTATAGTIDANGYDLNVGGNLVISGDLTNPAALTFDGSADQSVSYAPGTLSVPQLVVDKTGSLLLGTNATVTTTASIRNGTLDVNGNTLTFPNGTTLYNASTLTGNVVFERLFSLNQDGWRMITSPIAAINYSSLNTSFHTQGAPWADFTEGTATLQAADFAAQDWSPITGADAAFTAGDGYIFYMYSTLYYSAILPATWSVTGAPYASATRALSWNTVSTDSYNLVGNRTTGKVDWDAAVAASTNVASTYATWDPALTDAGGLTGYKYYSSASGVGLAGRYIAPFTAFMVEPTASGGSLVFSTSEAANLQSANQFGKRTGITPHLRLMIEGEGSAELETYLLFSESARDGPDPLDAHRMRPLSTDFVSLVSMDADRRLAFDGRSMAMGRQDFTLGVAATRAGTYTLSWPELFGIPDSWRLSLFDRSDGRTIDLRSQPSLTFLVRERDLTMYGGPHALAEAVPRFTLTVLDPDADPTTDPDSGTGPNASDQPDPTTRALLAQNYPNPFNPETSFRFSLPRAGDVRIEVFDLLGRRVAVPLDENRPPGWHEVRWHAGSLPSGMYIYRLTTGSEHLTQAMMLQR